MAYNLEGETMLDLNSISLASYFNVEVGLWQ